MQKIEEYAMKKDEISLLHITVPLSFFCLDCIQVNDELAGRAQKLKDRLIQYEVNENRDLNKKYVMSTMMLVQSICHYKHNEIDFISMVYHDSIISVQIIFHVSIGRSGPTS